MEDRLEPAEAEASGGTLIALAVILAVTVGWWALALWPAGAVEPEWLARTRAACFGSVPGSGPDAGGWILLIGEPLGMAAMIAVVFGRSLRRDVERIAARRIWRIISEGIAGTVALTLVLLAARGTGLWAVASVRATTLPTAVHRVDRAAPTVVLVDQYGRSVSLADLGGERALLTFAFGHCSTVCPAIVNNLRAARRERNQDATPIVIVTVDPWRDTPDRLPTLAEHWGLNAKDRVLSGSIPEVNRVLNELGVGRRRNEVNGDIDHAATVMIIDEHGRIAWRADGEPRGIVALLREM